LSPRVIRRISQIEDTQVRNVTERFIGSFQAACRKGVAIGPDISHVLADIAMEEVDAEMSKRWPGCYFRYVDDVIVVCKPTEVDQVQNILKDLLSPLELHDGKQDVVTQSVWHQHCPQIVKENSLSSFGGLTRAIELMLLHAPEKSASLESRFLEAGFSIPFRRLAIGMHYGRFQKVLKWILDSNVRLISRLSIGELVAYATAIRNQLISQLENLATSGSTTGTQRRWYVQNARFRINRLLYLMSPEQYDKLLNLIPPGPEFDEQRLLVNAVSNNDPLSLLPYPGPTVGTYCELMIEREPPSMPESWPLLTDRAMSESATMFALYFGWKIPTHASAEMFTGSRILLNRFSDGVDDVDRITKQTYLDEVELLLRDTDAGKRLKYVRTRVSSREIKGLEAFGLGDNYS